MKKKNKFSTGEFAKYFGLKKDTLLYYDKINLFSPAGVQENGYRYYTAAQLDFFRTLRSFRELDVPIKELQSYFESPTPVKLYEMSKAQLVKIEKEAEKLHDMKVQFERITNKIEEAKSNAYAKVYIRQLPDMRFIYFNQFNGTRETSDRQWFSAYEDFLASLELSGIDNINNIGSVIAKKDIKTGNFKHIDRLYTASADSSGFLRKGGDYAVYYYSGKDENLDKAYTDLLNQLSELGYELTGDSYEEYLIDELATDNTDEYVTKITVKVEKTT